MSYIFKHNPHTEAERDAITTPTDGLVIYNTDRDRLEFYEPYWGWSPISVDGSSRDWGVESLHDMYINTSNGLFIPSGIGTGSASSFITINENGIILQTGTTDALSGYQYSTNFNSITFGLNLNRFESRILIPTLATAGEDFIVKSGFHDNSIADVVDGAYFLADTQGTSTGSAASGNWQIVTTSANIRTFTTTSVAIDNTNFQKLRVDVNAAGTEVNFYINGTLAGTHTTNIPTGLARVTGVGTLIRKSVGTANRTVNVDYLYYKMKFTTPR